MEIDWSDTHAAANVAIDGAISYQWTHLRPLRLVDVQKLI